MRRRVRKWPALLINLILFGLAADFAGSIYLREAQGVKLLDQFRANLVPPSESVVDDASDHRLGIFAAADAVRVPLDTIPTVFHDVLVRWEDTRFYAHDGVDRIRMLGAVIALLHGAPEGGSTLTMQLAKLIKKDSARTLRRKLEDIALALALDNRLGKSEVLKYYSNQAYFGSGVYGLGQACRYYFDLDNCEGMNIEQAAYLVSLLRAPADLSRDPARALARRNLVIDQMREPDPAVHGDRFQRFAHRLYIAMYDLIEHDIGGRSELIGRYSNAMLDEAKKQPLSLARYREPTTDPFVLETAREELQKRLGASIYEDGLNVRLTINADVQKAAQEALAFGLNNYRALRKATGHHADADLDGGVVVIDPRTGHLLAYVPGADFHRSQVPFAARPIQVGSAMKPFVYGEMFEQRKGDIDTLVKDAPLCIGGWCPHDYEARYHGDVPVWFALSRSLNTAAVRTADLIGVDALTARLRLLGVTSPLTANLPMALGASELTLLELGGIYSGLWDGRAVKPRLVMDVRDRDGNILYGGDQPKRPLVYSPTTIDMLHLAMESVMAPGGTAAFVSRQLESYFGVPPGKHLGEVPGLTPQFACKTGTHDKFTRVGLSCVVSDTDFGPLVMTAYIGDLTPKSLGEGLDGGRVAGPIIEKLVEAVTAKTRASGFFRPFPQLAASPVRRHVPGKPNVPMKPAKASKPILSPENTALLTETLRWRALYDPDRAAYSLGLASMAGPADEQRQQATVAVSESVPRPGPSAESSGLSHTGAVAGPRLSAPRDWEGLRVLDTDVVEASGPDIIRSFLKNGGREDELTELAPLLGMTIERRVIHEHRLLRPGFIQRPMMDRLVQLSDRVFASLRRMMSTQVVVTQYEHPDPNTHILWEADADRKVERIYRFARQPLMFRVTMHRTSGVLLALEWEDADGKRHAVVRENGRMVPLSTREVVVRSGSLEPAWIAAGMSPAQLDGLRGLIGQSMSIDHIHRGFRLDLLTTDTGGLQGVEATEPDAHGGAPAVASGIRIGSACLSQEGTPCGRRFMPLPLAEARLYAHRASGDTGDVLIQRASPGTIASTPEAGLVIVADADRDRVVVATRDGRTLQFSGIDPTVRAGDAVSFGAALGRLDSRGVLVYEAEEWQLNGRLSPLEATSSLPLLGGADQSLRDVANWWHDLQGWLEGDEPLFCHASAGQHS